VTTATGPTNDEITQHGSSGSVVQKDTNGSKSTNGLKQSTNSSSVIGCAIVNKFMNGSEPPVRAAIGMGPVGCAIGLAPTGAAIGLVPAVGTIGLGLGKEASDIGGLTLSIKNDGSHRASSGSGVTIVARGGLHPDKSLTITPPSELTPTVAQLNEKDVLKNKICLDLPTLTNIFSSKTFKDDRLERMFRQYFFKLNQDNLSVLMALMIIICMIQTIEHYLTGSQSIIKGVLYGLLLVIMVVLEVLCNHSQFSHRKMTLMCVTVCIMAGLMIVFIPIDSLPRSASDGVSETVFLVFMIYTLLPVRMRFAVCAGVVLPAAQLITSVAVNHSDWFIGRQVRVL